jgi:hypothetical protein
MAASCSARVCSSSFSTRALRLFSRLTAQARSRFGQPSRPCILAEICPPLRPFIDLPAHAFPALSDSELKDNLGLSSRFMLLSLTYLPSRQHVYPVN